MIRFKKRIPICEKGSHENIDVICHFIGSNSKFNDRVCKICHIPERLQEDEDFIKSLKDAEKHLIKIGMIEEGHNNGNS